MQSELSRREFFGSLLAAAGLTACSKEPWGEQALSPDQAGTDDCVKLSRLQVALDCSAHSFVAKVRRASTYSWEANVFSEGCYQALASQLQGIGQKLGALQQIVGAEHEPVGEVNRPTGGAELSLKDRLNLLLDRAIQLKQATSAAREGLERGDIPNPAQLKVVGMRLASCQAYLEWCAELRPVADYSEKLGPE